MFDAYVKVFMDFKPEIINALLETFEMMLFAGVITLVFGLLMGFFLFITRPSGLYGNSVLYLFLSGFINLIRSIPFILFILVLIPVNRFLIGTGFGVNASKIPLSLIGVSTFARFVEQDLLDVDKNTYETSYAMGASVQQYFTHFLLKEARSGIILSYTSSLISLLSYSTVMGIIGGGGLGYLAMSEGYHNFNYKLMWIIIVIMIVIVQTIQTLGNGVSNKLDKR